MRKKLDRHYTGSRPLSMEEPRVNDGSQQPRELGNGLPLSPFLTAALTWKFQGKWQPRKV